MAPDGKVKRGKKPVEVDETTEEGLLDALSSTLESLASSPFDVTLHQRHIDLATKLGLPDQVDEAREMMSQYFPLDEATWLARFEAKQVKISANPDDLEPHLELMELYKRATQDFLSIPILLSYSDYFISNHYTALGLSPPVAATEDQEDDEDAPMTASIEARKAGEPNPVLGAAFEIEDVRKVMEEILQLAYPHLAESKKVWTLWRDFEMDLYTFKIHDTPLKIVEDLYTAYLKHPHLGVEATFEAYSSLVTRYDNAHYGQKLPAANKDYANSLSQTSEREAAEVKLRQAQYTLPAYQVYIAWEMEPKLPNFNLLLGLFERAVQAYPKDIEMWDLFVDFSSKRQATAFQVVERALRTNPESAQLWATYFRLGEKAKRGTPAVEGLFERAISTGLFQKDLEGLVVLYEARAGLHRREVEILTEGEEDIGGDVIDKVVEVLEEGIAAIREISGKRQLRDPSLRLEKNLIRQMERFGRIDEAAETWERLTKDMSSNAMVWHLRADFEMRTGDVVKAHKVYQEGCSQKGLDYPEFLLDAWMTFEKQSGNLADLEYTMKRIKRQLKGLEGKRLREAQAAAAAQAEAYGEVQAVSEPVAASVTTEQAAEAGPSNKRQRSPVDEAPRAKKAKNEVVATGPVEPKRDRENSTIFVVTTSDATVEEDDLKKLFKDCGEIREAKLKTIGGQLYAMIEFMDKDSVPAAQTKDKKKIHGFEVDVHIAWKSCLWITNYPESHDVQSIEALFSPYGTIFETRWPSKRFKDTRRFCYVQFTSPESAEASLALHGKQFEGGAQLSVLVSDPSVRTKRSDAGANKKELYVSGYNKHSVKEYDLRKLFEPFGVVKEVRMPADDKGEGRGFAYVEFEEESAAQAGLSLNGQDYKKRSLAVSFPGSRHVGLVKEAPSNQSRTTLDQKRIRVRGIPAGTEEAIVQQAFEKVASVKLVVMTLGATEAIIELTDAAEAGKVLLAASGITIADSAVEIIAESPQARAAEGKKKAPAVAAPVSATGQMMPRQAAGRRRGGLGHRGARGGIGSGASSRPTPSTGTAPTTTTGGGKSQDDFRALLGKK